MNDMYTYIKLKYDNTVYENIQKPINKLTKVIRSHHKKQSEKRQNIPTYILGFINLYNPL